MQLEYEEYEEYFKGRNFNILVIVVGNTSTGKTTFIQTFDKGVRPNHTSPTVGVNFCPKNMRVEKNQKVKLHIWDTAGQEQYRSITMSYNLAYLVTTVKLKEPLSSLMLPIAPPSMI